MCGARVPRRAGRDQPRDAGPARSGDGMVRDARPCQQDRGLRTLPRRRQTGWAAIPQAADGFIPHARVIHTGTMEVDDAIAWIGTSNREGGCLDHSRNVELVLRDSVMAARVGAPHRQLWNSLMQSRSTRPRPIRRRIRSMSSCWSLTASSRYGRVFARWRIATRRARNAATLASGGSTCTATYPLRPSIASEALVATLGEQVAPSISRS